MGLMEEARRSIPFEEPVYFWPVSKDGETYLRLMNANGG
jgi:hypothetical protein